MRMGVVFPNRVRDNAEEFKRMEERIDFLESQLDDSNEELVEALEELEVAQEENGILRARLNQLMSDRTVSV
jgi:regulator of replication initiation timing